MRPKSSRAEARVPVPAAWFILATFGVLAAGTAALVAPGPAAAPGIGAVAPAQPTSVADGIAEACGGPNPYFAGTRFAGDLLDDAVDGQPAVVAFRMLGASGTPEQITLATVAEVGAVYGLAYDPGSRQLYAAAYHRRGAGFGPGGPGAIYRLDLASGAIDEWASMEAGPDRHKARDNDDQPAVSWLGRASLADIDLDAATGRLYVANLYDGRIHVFSTDDGREVTSFPNGAAGEEWRRSAVVFGLGLLDGVPYHGVANALDLTGHIYSSDPDGGSIEEVATFDLPGPWITLLRPVLNDIAFRRGGGAAIGARSLQVDGFLSRADPLRIGGQLFRADTSVTPWLVQGGAGSSFGAVATFPGLDLLVTPAYTYNSFRAAWTMLVRWVDGDRHERQREGRLAGSSPNDWRALAGMGDVEALCAPRDTLDPGWIATATSSAAKTATVAPRATETAAMATRTALAPTITARATVVAATLTAHAPTETAVARGQAGTATALATRKSPALVEATATAAAANLVTVGQSCGGDNPYFVLSCFAQNLTGIQLDDEPAIIAFNDSSALGGRPHIAIASQTDVGAVYGHAYDWRRRQVYVGAYHKRGTAFGPGGPGGIYRIDLNTGAVDLWARLDAGPDMHWQGTDFDRAGADWTGRVGLGDLEMADDGNTLLAVNLWDRRIYRLSIPDGRVIDSFPHGGAVAFWASDARPFALGVRDGYLYHGVMDSAESTAGGSLPTAFVYRSRLNGADMREVARVPMGYNRALPWGPWQWGAPESMPGPPLLTDIDFRPGGDLVLGFRERNGDTTVLRAGHGDLLLAEWVAPALAAVQFFGYYNDRVRHPETTWGSVASRPGSDVVVTTGVDPETIWSGGAFWFDNQTGNVVGLETIYVTDRRRVTDPTFAKTSGLGDIESLCPPVATPTVTASPTTTPTPTATRVPEPIYLPLILGERCTKRRAHADIVLVLDVSTSMRRQTAAGRRKMEAVQDAALLFLDQIRLTPDEDGAFDQVAIVGFNRDAWIAQGLTNRVADLQLAVEQLPERMEQFTRLDLGLRRGGQALADPARRPDNRGVVVLLTDGLPNQVPYAEDGTMETTVLRAAQGLKAADIRVFTIGVGRPDAPDPIDRINADLLRQVASEPEMFFQTPDAEELGEIYGEIAVSIGCPPGRHKWGEPWP